MKQAATFLIIFIVVLASFGQLIFFDVWQDDNALIFKLQHITDDAGVFGPGLLGLGVYKYIAVPYYLIDQFFGLNLTVFYCFTILFYFLASVSVFYVTKQLTKNIFLSFLSSLIFASGFIGSEGIMRLFNSIQTSYSVILACLTFIFLQKAAEEKFYPNLFLSYLFFYLSLELAYIRTQYLILPVFAFGLLFFRRWLKLSLLPFLVIFYLQYFQSPDPRTKLIWDFLQNLLAENLDYTFSFFTSVGNIILPQPVNGLLFSLLSAVTLDGENKLLILQLLSIVFVGLFCILLWIKNHKIISLGFFASTFSWLVFHLSIFEQSEKIFSRSLGDIYNNFLASYLAGLSLIASFFLICLAFKKNKNYALVVGVLIFWLGSNILTYAVYLPFTPLESISRYSLHSFIPLAIFLPLLLSFFLKRNTVFFLVSILIIVNISYSINYQRHFIFEKINPTKKFYSELKSNLAEIPKGSMLYFDVADDEISRQQYKDFFSVGSMPDTTAIAQRYGIDRYDFTKTENYADLKDIPFDKIFSFFYSKNGLENTTGKLREILSGQTEKTTFPNLAISPITPILLKFTAKAQIKAEFIKSSCLDPISDGDFANIFKYLASREIFLQKVKVSTQSLRKNSDLLTDGSANTFWRGSRGFWLENNQEVITLDLAQEKNISQLLWVNRFGNSTPLKYKIEVSLDGENFKVVKEIKNGARKKEFEETLEDFDPTPARFVRFLITETFDQDSPALSEIEVVGSQYAAVDKQVALQILNNPLACLDSQQKWQIVKNYYQNSTPFYLVWKTNKYSGFSENNTLKINLIPDNQIHTYIVVLPAGGTKLEQLKFGPSIIPLDLEISKITLENTIQTF